MNLFTLPPHVPFLDAVAAEWLALAGGDPLHLSEGLILLPTRRAARNLAEAFLRVSGGRALLLPRITTIGALDEMPLALAGALDLPPAVEPMQRIAALARLILAMNGRNGAPRRVDGAWRLAADLAALMDEAERAEIDLSRALPGAVDSDFAEHWAHTLEFLRIVTSAWPAWLEEQGVMNPAARQVALLDAQAGLWRLNPPSQSILLAGVTGAFPAVGRLARVIAGLPQGAVLLPGLDRELPEPVWAKLEDGHYQAGLRDLLHAMGATRGDVCDWPVRPATAVAQSRAGLLRMALLPGAALAEWRSGPALAPSGLWRLEAQDEQHEAMSIALILRDALERPGARAALVTPDRDLAGRVAAELSRFGVIADDSAGEKLRDTPPAVLLRLLAQAVAEDLAPVPLLALLKHPLAGAGLAPAACRAAARALELACLRGPRPTPGLTGLRMAGAPDGFLKRLERCLEPLLRVDASVEEPPAAWLRALITAAEALAGTDEQPGAARLWAAEEGEALAELLAGALKALPVLPPQRIAGLPGLLDALLEGQVVRSRRALRGRDGAEHPRVFIWGLLEARLQSAEVMVLGGLAEGVWPPAADPGPWLSRPMRARVGLPSAERGVGQAAHDFVAVSCAAPEVVLSCPCRREGAPAVPARWLTRLDALLAGTGLPSHPAAGWALALDQPDGPPKPMPPPRPCPPVIHRPRKLSVTEIETWIRDPYAIHARHILRLRALDPLDQETDAADYGSLVHAGLHAFVQRHGVAWPKDAAGLLRDALLTALGEARLRPALAAWWAPRLARIADWLADAEGRRRAQAPPLGIATELKGEWVLEGAGGFRLTGRADRIEIRPDRSLAIIDYKTGRPPAQKDVEAGLAPQLPLEGAMAIAGGFGEELRKLTSELSYWHLTGGWQPGDISALYEGNAALIADAVDSAAERLRSLIARFDDPATCYLAQPHPGRAPRFSDYAQLARVAEWAAAGDDDAGC